MFGAHVLTAMIIVTIILFTIIYCVLDRYSDKTHFNGIDETEKDYILPKLYYSIVTQASVGYGDISPKTTESRIAAMCQMSTVLFLGLYLASYIALSGK